MIIIVEDDIGKMLGELVCTDRSIRWLRGNFLVGILVFVYYLEMYDTHIFVLVIELALVKSVDFQN